MKDSNTQVGGPLVSTEVRCRLEGVLPSSKRESEERGVPEDPMLKCTDGSEMRTCEVQVILKSLGVISASGEMADLFCRNRFGGAAVDTDFHCMRRSSGSRRQENNSLWQQESKWLRRA